MTTDPTDVPDAVLERLRTLMHEASDLKDAARYYAAILPLVNAADLKAEPAMLTLEEMQRKMEAGVPLLKGIDLSLDISEARGLMLRLAAALENVCGKHNPEAHNIRKAFEQETLDVAKVLSHAASGRSDNAIAGEGRLNLNADLLLRLAENTLKPALRAWQRQLTPLTAGSSWEKGHCFICGTPPILAELQDNTQAKHLRCGQCGADWLFPRLRCAFCGNEDHRSLGVLYSERDREKMRVEFCDNCGGYLKVIASYSPSPAEMLTVEDLATLHLDFIAQEHGYIRGGMPLPDIQGKAGDGKEI